MTEPKIHYDKIANEYTQSYQESIANRRFFDFEFATLVDFTPLDLTHKSVLDCMSGANILAEYASHRIDQIHSLDISKNMLSRFSPEAKPSSRICGSAFELPYKDSTFDAAIIRGGLHHTPDAVSEVLKELHRVIKPGGWLVCEEAFDDNPLIHILRKIMHRLSDLYEEGERGFRRSELFRAFEECGFANVKSRPHGFVAYTLIGNTNVLPLFAGLRNRTLIDAMIGMDRAFSKIPIVHRFALAVLIRGQVMK